MLTDREYKYWITKNCPSGNIWVVTARLGEMLSHPNTNVYNSAGAPSPLLLTPETLQYVYLALFTETRVTTIVQDSRYYYLIDNEKDSSVGVDAEADIQYKSTIRFYDSISQLVQALPGAQRKRLELKAPDKAKLRAGEVTALQGVVALDFINKTQGEQISLWKRLVKQDRNSLNLTGYYLFDPQIIIDAAVTCPQEQVVVSQANKFGTLGWLQFFPRLKTLSLWYINTLCNETINQLPALGTQLTVLEFHSCVQLTGRILIPLSTMPLLEKLVINYERCVVQENTHETVISESEWGNIDNSTLDLLLIDTSNLTLDFIDYVLRHFRLLQHFIMNDEILAKLEKNSASGRGEASVTFHALSNTQHGFKRFRDVKVYDLIRNKHGNMFSDSMLKKIKERNPDKALAADILSTKAGVIDGSGLSL